jgi:MoaA/NifB/PqqE/SkfB family radical SAM enzyme
MAEIRKIKNKTSVLLMVRDRLHAPIRALNRCYVHRRSLGYIRRNFGWKQFLNTVKVYFLIRGENVGEGVMDPVYKFFPSLAPYPIEIETEFSTICNVNCIQCEYRHWDPKQKLPDGRPYKGQNFTFEQFKHMIDEFPGLIWINPTGEGSPFLNPSFLKTLEYLKKKKVYTTFASEGFNWNHEIAQKLVEIGADKVWFSVDAATKETYQKIRVGSNWETVWTNIRDLVETKRKNNSPLPELGFHFTPMTHNRKELIAFIDKIADLQEEFGGWVAEQLCIEFQQVVAFGPNSDLAYEPMDEEISKVHEHAKERGVYVYYSRPSYDESTKPLAKYCVAWTEPYFLINGDVVPCCACIQRNNRDWLHKNTFGNIFKTPFKEIWYSDRYKKFRKLVVDPNGKVPRLCQGCRPFSFRDRIEKYGVSEDI